MRNGLLVAATMIGSSALAATTAGKVDPVPGDPLTVTMGRRKPAEVRVARGQATLFRLPEGQRVMSTYGGDKGEAGVWSVDAGKVPTRYLAVKPKEIGIHTVLHVVSNTGQEVSFFLREVTGTDTQFDAEVDAEAGEASGGRAGDPAPVVKWVPAEDVQSCKTHSEQLAAEAAQAARKAQQETAAAVASFQASYPRQLSFGFTWDEAKAEKLGFEAAWSDDKFTYFRGNRVLALYEINEDGKASLIRYSYADGLYTVPKLLYDGYFAIGEKKENKLAFHRDRRKS